MKKALLATVLAFSASYAGDLTSYIIPMYSYPVGQYQTEWNNLYNLNTSKNVYVIINPSNGPGRITDPNYVDAINKLKAKGFHVIGYVHTSYGARKLPDVKSDISKWISLYGTDKIDGFFVDEVSSDTKKYPYYSNIYTYIRSKGKLTILNPGTNINTSFFNISNKIVVVENGETSFESFQYNNYKSINSDRVCSIIYGTSSDKVPFVINKMLNNNSSCGYVTDKSGNSTYFYLSSYLN